MSTNCEARELEKSRRQDEAEEDLKDAELRTIARTLEKDRKASIRDQ